MFPQKDLDHIFPLLGSITCWFKIFCLCFFMVADLGMYQSCCHPSVMTFEKEQ